MKIGIIGAGNVGKALGQRFAEAGHDVEFGLRQGSEVAVPTGTSTGTVAEAAAYGEVVVVATPWAVAEQVVESAGDLNGKVLFDCMNSIRPDFSGLAFDLETSVGEQLALLAPGAKVVKIFNTVGYNIMLDPSFGGSKASMLYCGDDADAKAVGARLAADIGFDPVDAGPLIQARYLEALAWLWISMAIKYGHGREIAFELVKR